MTEFKEQQPETKLTKTKEQMVSAIEDIFEKLKKGELKASWSRVNAMLIGGKDLPPDSASSKILLRKILDEIPELKTFSNHYFGFPSRTKSIDVDDLRNKILNLINNEVFRKDSPGMKLYWDEISDSKGKGIANDLYIALTGKDFGAVKTLIEKWQLAIEKAEKK